MLVVEDHALGTNDCRGWIRRAFSSGLVFLTVTSISSASRSTGLRQKAASR